MNKVKHLMKRIIMKMKSNTLSARIISVGYVEQQIISCLENNSCRHCYLYNCKYFSYENPDPENKVYGNVACSDYIGSMKKAIEVESPSKKK